MKHKPVNVLGIAQFVILITVICLVGIFRPIKVEVTPYSDSDIFKTVAHLNISNPELELIYTDSVNDVAYYRYVGERNLLKVGDSVTLSNDSVSTVVNVELNGFYLEYRDNVYVGMSGTPVFDADGNTVGYVSELLDNKVYCIWN